MFASVAEWEEYRKIPNMPRLTFGIHFIKTGANAVARITDMPPDSTRGAAPH